MSTQTTSSFIIANAKKQEVDGSHQSNLDSRKQPIPHVSSIMPIKPELDFDLTIANDLKFEDEKQKFLSDLKEQLSTVANFDVIQRRATSLNSLQRQLYSSMLEFRNSSRISARMITDHLVQQLDGRQSIIAVVPENYTNQIKSQELNHVMFLPNQAVVMDEEVKQARLEYKVPEIPKKILQVDSKETEVPVISRRGGNRKRKPLESATTEIAPNNNKVRRIVTNISDDNNDKKQFKLTIKLRPQDSSSLLSNQKQHTLSVPDELKPNSKEMRAVKRQYDTVYLNVWKDMARKDCPRIYRLVMQSEQAKLINLRKTALLAARESSKWKIRTNKNIKDLQTKARRSMREMFNFWKKNEREERELRKKAEKEAIDLAKKQEEERENQRQSRKLNFLLTQTELYSHFIGKKIKTDEIEGSDKDNRLEATINPTKDDKYDNIEEPVNAVRTDISNIDFDNVNDDELTRRAAENAQSALMEAKSRADEFNNQDDASEMNFQNPTSLPGDIHVDQPKLLTCTLKEYQLKGLNWLANLYDKGINGILADEMGLGKTVQSISTLAYLAETHNIWGPFLVVTPASTLHNWQQELTKFVPDFKVLPYWGNAKDRKILRKFWDRKNVVYNKDSPFHVLVTSYQLIVADAQYFQKIKWQYMILDEAQAIKSSQSSRWRILLGLQCRNRLLLTGTPIQNSMQELWALLHFIMPSLFDNHDEFSEWFSKDIENHANTNSKLNEAQLRRLHMILKPFMLRRIKKNVQKELGDKVEIDVFCQLTNRQRRLYQILKSQINLFDILQKNDTINSNNNSSDAEDGNLMNLVMQFRKVCNHPDLFERADTISSFNFGRFGDTISFMKEANEPVLDLMYSNKNLIEAKLPKIIYDEIITINEQNNIGIYNKIVNYLFNIWNEDYLKDKRNMVTLPNSKNLRNGYLEKAIDLKSYNKNDDELLKKGFLEVVDDNQNLAYDADDNSVLSKLRNVKSNYYEDNYIQVMESAAEPRATAPLIEVICSDRGFENTKNHIMFNHDIRKALMPLSLNEQYDLFKRGIPVKEFPKAEMLPEPLNKTISYSTITIPSMNRFISESGKLAKLDEMLPELQKNDHRVLIYFQMTKMMDLMEEYLTYRQYKFIRLDGSSKLDDRRDLVHDWQTKPELFIFLLSTRAGGLGINLTAADTVIFYDSDWNPTIDSQAMDRAHRLGQTRQVTVYRLVVRGTIEERMRDRAKQKEHVQQVVMEGNANSNKNKTYQIGAGVENENDKNHKSKKEEVAYLLF